MIEIINISEKALCDAAKDFYYLINRGYTRKVALNVVSNRYGLNKNKQMIIYRSIFPSKIIDKIKSKEVSIHHLKDNILAVDWYNILITVNSGVVGVPLYLGNDGFIRDIRGLYGRMEAMQNITNTIDIIINVLLELPIRGVKIYLEKNVSYSGEMRKELENILKTAYMKEYNVILTQYVDKAMIQEDIVATSDSYILMECKKIFNLIRYILEQMNNKITIFSIPV